MRWPALAACLLLAGCGSGGSKSHDVRVGAASSLTGALTACAPHVAGVAAKVEFGGSDQIAAQIRQGIGLDVFASANTALPEALAREKKVQPPVAFATNELVLAIPADSPIRSVASLAGTHPVRVAMGAASVPVGAYTRQVLARLPKGQGNTILADTKSFEPDVKGIVGKLVTGAVDAGFVYKTDVRATDGHLRAIRLPASLRPTVVYDVAAVNRRPESLAFVKDLLHGGCARELRRAGFGAPPQ